MYTISLSNDSVEFPEGQARSSDTQEKASISALNSAICVGVDSPRKHTGGRLIISVIYNHPLALETALTELEKRFGHIDAETEELEFLGARAYIEEMGDCLKRRVFCFVEPIDPYRLVDFKLRTRKIEEKLSEKVGGIAFRSVNIDPLVMTSSGMTLATSSDGPHRICIGKDIYAEKTLALIGKKFKPFVWTHPNYAESDMIEFAEYALSNIKTVPAELKRPTSLASTFKLF